MRPNQIALQLYTVRRLAAVDLPGTLARVAAAGYESVEVAGIAESDLDRLAALLRENGLRAIAAHEGFGRLQAAPSQISDWLAGLECPRVIVPSFSEDERRSPGDVRRLVGELNRLASTLAERGIRLGYHNHASEFEPLGDTTVWDILLAELAPGIELEIDVYWASVGGRDPVEVIHDAAGRVKLLHMKDRESGEPPRDAPAGHGILDFPAIVEAARAAGVEWYIAEQDEPADARADIASAYEYLQSLAVGAA
jgi:sugar phosphate isomerase/epimerase